MFRLHERDRDLWHFFILNWRIQQTPFEALSVVASVALRVIQYSEVITMNFRPPMGGFGQPAMGGMMGPGTSGCISYSALASETDLDTPLAGMGQPMIMGGPRPGYGSPMPLGEARTGQSFSVHLLPCLLHNTRHTRMSVRRPPAGPIAKSTTLYVGKIAPTIPEDVIRSLLEACGTVKSWKPVLNEDGSPKGFGFCEYQSPDAVTRALRLLNNLKVDGQELLLKCTSATERYIQQHQVRPWCLQSGRLALLTAAKGLDAGHAANVLSLLSLRMLRCTLYSEVKATPVAAPVNPWEWRMWQKRRTGLPTPEAWAVKHVAQLSAL